MEFLKFFFISISFLVLLSIVIILQIIIILLLEAIQHINSTLLIVNILPKKKENINRFPNELLGFLSLLSIFFSRICILRFCFLNSFFYIEHQTTSPPSPYFSISFSFNITTSSIHSESSPKSYILHKIHFYIIIVVFILSQYN